MSEEKSQQYFPDGKKSKFTTKIRKDANGRIKSSRVPIDNIDEEGQRLLQEVYKISKRKASPEPDLSVLSTKKAKKDDGNNDTSDVDGDSAPASPDTLRVGPDLQVELDEVPATGPSTASADTGPSTSFHVEKPYKNPVQQESRNYCGVDGGRCDHTDWIDDGDHDAISTHCRRWQADQEGRDFAKMLVKPIHRQELNVQLPELGKGPLKENLPKRTFKDQNWVKKRIEAMNAKNGNQNDDEDAESGQVPTHGNGNSPRTIASSLLQFPKPKKAASGLFKSDKILKTLHPNAKKPT